eukprot:788516-Rhodomonas_salina.4
MKRSFVAVRWTSDCVAEASLCGQVGVPTEGPVSLIISAYVLRIHRTELPSPRQHNPIAVLQ